MEGESLKTLAERFSTLLYHQLRAQMPRPGGIHKYSKGGMLRGFTMKPTETGYHIVMSNDIPYSHLAMGFNADGSRRSPRGNLESINFQTIDNCLRQIGNYVAKGANGRVVFNK
ncbi:MAG: hypothetical protein J6R47_03560 [Acholeplasmatales bacterium]|nr:hypothetical protein [Acholeplasmatales bacterium]